MFFNAMTQGRKVAGVSCSRREVGPWRIFVTDYARFRSCGIFFQYNPPRPLHEIEADLKEIE